MAWPAVGPRVWLGRLCQYVRDRDPACTPGDWTLDRFSPAAVRATNVALDQLKARAQSARIVLVGWSGGGTLAALVAAERSDIDALVTIAAPLDLAAWTTQMRISPLPAEGDPARVVTLRPVARWVHLHGGRDGVVRAQPQIEAARSLGAQALLWPGETHACCWARRAGEIAELIRPPAP